MRFLDANIFLRLLAPDDPAKGAAVERLMLEIEGDRELATTSEAVVCEVVYVLKSTRLYAMERGEIRDRVQALLLLPGLRLPHRHAYLRALDLFAENAFLDLEDALCIAHMERLGITEIYSYDRDFDRVGSVQRVEP